MKRVQFLMVVSILAVAACRDEAPKMSDPGLGTTTAATALDAATETNPASPESPGGTAIVPEVESGVPVAVTLEDNRLGIPTTIAPGPVVFSVKNAGTGQHSLAIEGQQIAVQLEPRLDPGQAGTLDVTLKEGTYRAYCPVLDHGTKGESVQVEVKR